MPNVYDTSVGAVSGGTLAVEVKGLTELRQTMAKLAPDIEKERRQTVHEAGQTLLRDARGYAVMGHSPTGAYSGSLSMKDLVNGVKILSDDPGAGAIEFANAGAVYLGGPRAGQRIGTPAVAKPKALIKAKEEHEPNILNILENSLAECCDRVRGA